MCDASLKCLHDSTDWKEKSFGIFCFVSDVNLKQKSISELERQLLQVVQESFQKAVLGNPLDFVGRNVLRMMGCK